MVVSLQSNKNAYIGNVVRILSSKTIVVSTRNSHVNVGTKVEVVQIFDVLHDIDGTEIGPLIRIKSELEVIQSEAGYVICEKKVPRKTAYAFSPILEKEQNESIDLPVRKGDIEPVSRVEEILVGDKVRLA